MDGSIITLLEIGVYVIIAIMTALAFFYIAVLGHVKKENSSKLNNTEDFDNNETNDIEDNDPIRKI